jgi:polyprenyl-phospho-N-acetylgalactosaminyl synthase
MGGRGRTGVRDLTVPPPADTCVVVPAFNESRMLARVLADLTRLAYTVVVVDDGSDDDTAARAAEYPVVVLRHPFNLGQGAALQTGIAYAIRIPQTRFIVTFDADGQHTIEDIPRLLAPLRAGTHDVVLGSRFLESGETTGIRPSRKALLKLAAAFTRLTTGLRLTDAHNGLRAMTVEVAAALRITQNRMAHASEVLSQIAALKLRYCEVPIRVHYTAYSVGKGQSSLNSINILWDLLKEKMR